MPYPRFIEVHDKETGDCFAVNVDHIVSAGKSGMILQGIPTDIALATVESYDELKALITETGCLIHKADPRLERTPVSWDDLCRLEMIGEPVFNSNTRRWMLLIDSASDGSWIQLVNHAGGQEQWIQHDVQRFPLYRMMK